MNITEANHLTKLLRYMLDPDGKVQAEQAREAVEYLAQRARQALLTGLSPEQASALFDAYAAQRATTEGGEP